MKTEQIAYALIRKNSRRYAPRFSPLIIDGRVPAFWNKKRADNEAEKRKCDVIKVIVKPIEDL